MLVDDVVDPDRPPMLGVHLVPGGADVAVQAADADRVDLVWWDDQAVERCVTLRRRAQGIHFSRVPGLRVGDRYGFRAHGRWDPSVGLRHNPAKLLLDPYARAMDGPVVWRPEVFGHVVGPDLNGDPNHRDARDSAPYVPRGVVVDDRFDWGEDQPPHVPWSRTVLYEAHVRGLTRRLPGVPADLQGTYAGLAHPVTLQHLVGLGVTTVELLPVHAFVSEPSLVRRGLTNYWGYNTLGFFAPHADYASAKEPGQVLTEFKGMVKLLHDAGLEVVLDVVYNHTGEQAVTGPTLSWRGLDAATYYRLDPEGHDVDMTGCGNTLDLSEQPVVRMVLDSLRYWVEHCHVDGFRFDLATTLARGRDGRFDPDHPFLVALRSDPVLARVKLIAEPWDAGPDGWRTGGFPPPLAQWNDRFRDDVRTFWLAGSVGEGQGVRDLATRLSGSQDLFGRATDRPEHRAPARGDGPLASVNYVASHDGFTLADTTRYDRKHNASNGEDGRDGHDDNRSWNHGVEGRTDDPVIRARRHRSMRNLLGTVLLSSGVPMITAGDEMGRTQEGNNNAYCHDDESTWVDWRLEPWQQDLLTTTRHLVRLRHELPALRARKFFDGRPVHEDGTTDVAWFDVDGRRMDDTRWHDPSCRTVQMLRHDMDGHRDQIGGSVLVVMCGHQQGAPDEVPVTLPPEPWAGGYLLLWDSVQAVPRAPARAAGTQHLQAGSVRLYLVEGVATGDDQPT